MAVAWAGNYSSDSTPSLGTSICQECSPKKKKKANKTNKQINKMVPKEETLEGWGRWRGCGLGFGIGICTLWYVE